MFKQVQEAIGGISSAAQATSPTDEKHGHAGIGELAAALNEFDVSDQAFCSYFKDYTYIKITIYYIANYIINVLCINLLWYILTLIAH